MSVVSVADPVPASLTTKSYVDSAVAYVSAKIPNSYTKTETDNLLNAKASSDDVRFNTVATSQPEGSPPEGQVFIWVSTN
ncbi:MAG: hypothetical protein KBS86_00215 [Proteobacteria bacterium]|nr:hypothetical protein [Candidatus Enterousia scatequi]